MKFFTKQERLVVAGILLLIIVVSLPNFVVAIARARNSQRKNDLGTLKNGLTSFQKDLRAFPLSSQDGRIMACSPTLKEVLGEITIEYKPCDWGKDALADEMDPEFPAYIPTLPQDPKVSEGASYLYFSNGGRFQIYAYLEVGDDDEFNPKVVARGLMCGTKVCSFGVASSDTPLDKSIEEYENELLEKQKLLQE